MLFQKLLLLGQDLKNYIFQKDIIFLTINKHNQKYHNQHIGKQKDLWTFS